MWSTEDETSPVSPSLLSHIERPKPTLRDRDSKYYKHVKQDRDARLVMDRAELEYGWGGNAGAYREPVPHAAEPAYEFTASIANGQRAGLKIQDLVDPLDMREKPAAPSSMSRLITRPSRNCFTPLFKRLRLFLTQSPNGAHTLIPPSDMSGGEKRKSGSSQAVLEAEIERSRDMRKKFLAQRKARGSIMYQKETGLAQIPLYAAPATAQLPQAPALSSFAPIAPLRPKAAVPSKASASASATINLDGNVLEIKKQEPFHKRDGRRYSAFVRQV